ISACESRINQKNEARAGRPALQAVPCRSMSSQPNTLVEQPLFAAWVDGSQVRMREAAVAQGLPIIPHELTPEIVDSFWVNLVGKGYPAPRLILRWRASIHHGINGAEGAAVSL